MNVFERKMDFYPHFSVHTNAIKCPLTCNGFSCLYIYIYWTLQAEVIWKWKVSASLHARFWGLDWVRLVGSLCLGQLFQADEFWLIHYMHVWWIYQRAHPERDTKWEYKQSRLAQTNCFWKGIRPSLHTDLLPLDDKGCSKYS